MRFRLPRLSDRHRLVGRWWLARLLSKRLPRSGGLRRVVVARTSSPGMEHRLRMVKDRSRLVLEFDHRQVLRDPRLFRIYRQRTGVLIDMFARTDPSVREAKAEISDGGEGERGRISYCSFDDGSILVPDSDFRNAEGYAEARALGTGPGPAWPDRLAGFCWRGSSTGKGLVTAPGMDPGNRALIQRTRLCLLTRGIPGADMKMVRINKPAAEQDRHRELLRGAGIFGDPIPSADWRGRKFAMDIDGNSNAWSNLFTRMLLGCCVIKVGSPKGYRQWYYADLEPFEHFVPVAADLSDLAERLEWCRGHDAECARIASRAQGLALEMTLERELARGVAWINQAFSG